MSTCTVCQAQLPEGATACSACGAPADASERGGEKTECRVCGGMLWSKAETCIHCDARGYPALRPKMGDKSEGAPADWKPRS